ncbi:HD family phosphohydrolase [Calothrix sp. 336/3]|uniref:HD family phosphohydrolase n=1 Tax=Calothrix sp. 336/3 TaxID=1337936 RepID=UPI0004E3ACAD|nr:HD family phosphohydrolase [Calothrix sp. 336/3]AKG21856.1 phosphohydrolase [Calothrix sp. 336/3]
MKKQSFFQSLTQQLNWGRRHKTVQSSVISTYEGKRRGKRGKKFLAIDIKFQRSPVIVAIAVLSLTGMMGHKLYTQPQLKVGTTAPETIKATSTRTIEDKKQTRLQRDSASKVSLPVLMVDGEVNQKIDRNLQKILNEGNEIRLTAGSFPFFNSSYLSLSTQDYLRGATEAEWQSLLQVIEYRQQQNSLKVTLHKLRTQQGSVKKTPDFFPKPDFTQAVAELEAYRISTSPDNLSSLLNQISQVRQKYRQGKSKLAKLISTKPDSIYKSISPLKFTDEDWSKTQMGIQQSAERILTQGIAPGLPQNLLQDAVSLQVQVLVPKQAEPLANQVLIQVLQPNLKQDTAQTRQLAAQAAAGVKPVMITVRKGQIIVSKGKTISEQQLEILEAYGLVRREVNWFGLTYLGGAVAVAVAIFAFVERRIHHRLRHRDYLLVLLLTLSAPLVTILGTPYTTWSTIGLLLGSFYGATLGVTVVSLLMGLLSVSLGISKVAILAGAAGGILGSCLAQKLRSREELAVLGVGIALTKGGVYFLAKLLLGAAFPFGSYIVIQEAGLFALSGLVWSIVALGLSPYLEKLFDIVTPIRLAELASPNRTLLKRLATEAPGTFQHTLFVATLAEAAGKKLGCNVELIRAGTLYHDIGKMHDPQGFIENQMGGPNKHDEIQDPWHSAAIIKKHVSEGLAIARKHSLPTAIQAFIPEHQGTMQIAYFYHQAVQFAKENPEIKVDEADFRYDGPIPQSRETGIVMLADSCEAALRSLKDATPEQALTMVNNILRARWQDHQMIDSGLNREEMTQIAEIFVEVWQQFHHKRIAYPKMKSSG